MMNKARKVVQNGAYSRLLRSGGITFLLLFVDTTGPLSTCTPTSIALVIGTEESKDVAELEKTGIRRAVTKKCDQSNHSQ